MIPRPLYNYFQVILTVSHCTCVYNPRQQNIVFLSSSLQASKFFAESQQENVYEHITVKPSPDIINITLIIPCTLTLTKILLVCEMYVKLFSVPYILTIVEEYSSGWRPIIYLES